MFTVKRLELEQLEKLMVIFADAEPPGAIVPTGSGKDAGLVITGVQTDPPVCVSVRPVIRAARAAPWPLLANEIVQTRAEYGPVLSAIRAVKDGIGPMFAVTVSGPVMVAVVCALALLATGPVQDAKT
jgi:hypothetical protein